MTERRVPQPALARTLSRRSTTAWGLAAGALFVALVGCGGGGGGSNTTNGGTTAGGTTAGTGATTVAQVNLANVPGKVDVTFLTGAGRAVGDRTAVVRRIQLQDANGVVEPPFAEKRLVLNRYSSQILDLNVPNVGTSRLFTNFQFDVLRYESEDDNGAGGTTITPYTSVGNLPANIPAAIRVFPGRTTHVPFFLDVDALGISDTESAPSFKIARFNAINFRPEEENTLKGRLADYMAFDITGLGASDRPTLSNGNPATRVLFSGDGYAASDGDPFGGTAVNFEPVLPGGQTDVIIGRLAGPSQIPSQGGTEGETPGTYSLIQADPSDVNSTLPRNITSLQGIWREHFRQRLNSTGQIVESGYLKDVHGFEMIAIPSSNDDGRQDVVAVSENVVTNANGTKRAVVTNCYFGYIDYDQSKFFLYPIKNLFGTNTGSNLQGEVSGTISATTTSGGVATLLPGSIANGKFAFTTGAPNGFPSSGGFVVLRR